MLCCNYRLELPDMTCLAFFPAFFNKDFKYLPLFCRLNQAGEGFERINIHLFPVFTD